MRRLVLLLLVLALGCGREPHEYPAEIVDNFMRACTAGGTSEAVCRCSLDLLRERYSAEAYLALEQQVARGEASADDVVQLTAPCRR